MAASGATKARPGQAAGQAEPAGSANGLGVERGPDWLFVRLERDGGDRREDLAESVWETIQEHGASRVVLELDRVEQLDETLRGAIAELGTRLRDAGGLIRICGLADSEVSKLRSLPAAAAVPHFGSRAEAVGTRRAGSGACE
jgi:hypothetical protein